MANKALILTSTEWSVSSSEDKIGRMFISSAAFWQYGLFWTHTAKVSAALHLIELQGK